MIASAQDRLTERSLTVGCFTGLADRLTVLLSGAALAEATDRRLAVRWPRTVHCGAAFGELFRSPWPVLEVSESRVRSLPLHDMRDRRRRRDLLTATEKDLAVRADGWMIDSEHYPAHVQLEQRCSELLAELKPLPEILDRVESFRCSAFRGRMVGVHLRRADYQLFDAPAAGSTRQVLVAVDGFLEDWPEARVLLCSDDGGIDTFTGQTCVAQGVHASFRARYGERVVFTQPRSLDRADPAAIQDALVDLLLLRATDAVVGTQGSSFSAMAAFGRAVPTAWCRSANPMLHLHPLWLWLRGRARADAVRFYYGRLVRRWLP